MASRRTPIKLVEPEVPSGSAPVELGSTGLLTSGGQVLEEFLPQLQGRRAYQVYKEMSANDAVVGASLRAIEMLVRQVQWRVEPASQDARDIEVAEFVDSALRDMETTWPDTLASILSFVRFGFSVFEPVYKKRDGQDINPTFHSNETDGRIGWAKLAPRSQETIERWIWDERGALLALEQVAPPNYRAVEIPWFRFLLFRTTTDKSNPEGVSCLRNAYRSYFFKKRIEEIEGIGIDRDLAGLPTALVPPEILAPNAGPELQQIRTHLEQLLRNIRRDAKEGIIFPLSYDDKGNEIYKLQLLNTGGRREFNTNEIISRYDSRIAMSVLADFVLLGHEKVGSFALASSKTELFAVALGAWLDSITEILNRQAIPRLLALNTFAFDEPPKLAHGDIETIDMGQIAEYVSKLVGAGVLTPETSLERHLRANAGLPEVDTEQLELERALAAPTTPAGEAAPAGAPAPAADADSAFDTADALSPTQVLNGAQITALVALASDVTNGFPRASALEIAQVSFGLSPETAEKIIPPQGIAREIP